MRTLCAAVVLCGVMASSAVAGENWPQFRGPGARGVSETPGLPTTWTATENIRWKRDLPGRGWSSPIVWGDRMFLTTVVSKGETEVAKKGLYFGGNRLDAPKSVHEWKIYCLNVQTGEPIWDKLLHEGVPPTGRHIKNSYASETPVTDGEHVYAYFGDVGLYCLDMDGTQVWKKELPAVKTQAGWGTASSPVLYKGRLYIVNDNDDESWLACFDANNGDQIWREKRDEESNWGTPYVWENDLRTELVVPASGKVRSYDLEGKLLYEFGGMSSITTVTPFAANGLLYLSSGYVLDKKKPIFAVRPGANGDISLADDKSSNDYIAWAQKQAGPYNPSTLVYGDLMYVLLDMGFFACYDAKTGAEVYGKKRIPDGKAFTSSPWAYDGKVFCLNEDGKTFVIKAGREFEILHVNSLEEDDMCMATPAMVDQKLLIRSATRVYCVQSGEAE